MSRSTDEIIEAIKDNIDLRIQLAVEAHGGKVNFVSYDNGHLVIELSGACAGCAGSTATLKYGIENMMKYYVPEVETIEAIHDENSEVEPYYKELSDDTNTKEI
jgi:Fe-S cluster biogenesis protein NfuA